MQAETAYRLGRRFALTKAAQAVPDVQPVTPSTAPSASANAMSTPQLQARNRIRAQSNPLMAGAAPGQIRKEHRSDGRNPAAFNFDPLIDMAGNARDEAKRNFNATAGSGAGVIQRGLGAWGAGASRFAQDALRPSIESMEEGINGYGVIPAGKALGEYSDWLVGGFDPTAEDGSKNRNGSLVNSLADAGDGISKAWTNTKNWFGGAADLANK